jgi:hypothetical protein
VAVCALLIGLLGYHIAARKMRELVVVRGSICSVTAVAFSPEGSRLAGGRRVRSLTR